MTMLTPSPSTETSPQSPTSDGPLALPLPSRLRSRQKSCNACVLGKRKCDRTQPGCSRCAVRSITCVYRRRRRSILPPESAAAAPALAPSSAQSLPPMTDELENGHNGEFDAFMDDADPDAALALATALGLDDGATRAQTAAAAAAVAASADPFRTSTRSLTSFAMPSPSPRLTSSMLDFMPSLSYCSAPSALPSLSTGSSSSSLLFNRFELCMALASIPDVEAARLSLALSKHQDCCTSSFSSWDASDPRTRTGYLVHTIKSLPVTFARERGTSFLHRQTFSSAVPRSAMHAWTACVIYAARTPATTAWAHRVVSDGLNGLLRSHGADDQPDKPTAHPPTLLPLQRLSRVFALLMYQIICVFDGDVALSARATRDKPVLLDWTNDLARLRLSMSSMLNLDNDALRAKPPSSWELWVFNESLRRVLFLSYMFMCVHDILQDQPPSPEIMSTELIYTSSSHLWEATTSVDFYRAWRDKPFWLACNVNMEAVLSEAKPEDLDELTRVFLVIKHGIDRAEHFISGVPEG